MYIYKHTITPLLELYCLKEFSGAYIYIYHLAKHLYCIGDISNTILNTSKCMF